MSHAPLMLRWLAPLEAYYGKGSAKRAEGELTAAFTDNHGWFWRNRTDGDLKITLRTVGDYSDVKVIE